MKDIKYTLEELELVEYMETDPKSVSNVKGRIAFIKNAIVEKMGSLKTLSYLEERAAKGSKENTLKLLGNSPQSKPVEWDKL